MSVQQGFTRLRDVGGADAGIASACAQQFFPAPHVHFGGPALSQTGGHGDMRNRGESNGGTLSNGISIVVDGEFAVRQATREAMRQGAGHVKLMLSGGVASPSDPLDGQQYSEAEIRAAVEESDAFGRYVAGHCYTSTSITRALLLGVRSIEHGNYADDATLDLITSRGAYLVPTLATYHMLAKEGAAHGLPPVSQAKVGDLLDAGLDTLQRAVMRGTPICFGTDLLGEMHGHQVGEFTLRAKVQPIIDVLRSATVTAATLLGVADRAGRVRPGMLADMAIYSVDPLSSPDVLARPDRFLRMVVVAGRAVLDRTHGRSP
jgi:imidazolonepropionase-like amidohydrolase